MAEGRVVVGTGVADGQAYALADTGGSALHQLTIDEMPSHSHPTDHGLLRSDQTNMQGLGDSWWRPPGTGTDYMITGTSVGGDQPHENRPPYLALLYCQKTLGTPAGAVVAFNAVSCPEGWSSLTLAEGRVVVGTSMSDGQAYALGDTGGSALHQLTIDEMPAHSHPTDHGLLRSDQTNTQGLGDSWWRHPGTGMDYMITGTSIGGDQPYENRPPYVALLHCQKNYCRSAEAACLLWWSLDEIALRRRLFVSSCSGVQLDLRAPRAIQLLLPLALWSAPRRSDAATMSR